MKIMSQVAAYEDCFETLEEARAEIKRLRGKDAEAKKIARNIMERTGVATFATQREIVKDLASQILFL